MSAADVEFARLLEAAQADERVVGVLLGGSRGKEPAYVTERSDYDVYVIVADEATRDEYGRRFPSAHGDAVEVIVATLDSFRSHALPGSGSEWNAYTFAHVTPLIDRLEGEIGRLAQEKAKRVPDTAAPPLLDGYINLHYRAAKNQRDGLVLEGHLDAAESMSWLIELPLRRVRARQALQQVAPLGVANAPAARAVVGSAGRYCSRCHRQLRRPSGAAGALP